MLSLKKKPFASCVLLTHEEWAKLKPLVEKAKITFEPSAEGKKVLVNFINIDLKTYNFIEELLEQI